MSSPMKRQGVAKPKIVKIPSQLNELLRRVVRRQRRIKRDDLGQ